MLTIEEIEAACGSPHPVKLPKNEMEPPEFEFEETFYPFGFPLTVRSNSDSVLEQYGELWGQFDMQYDREPIPVGVQLVESDSTECPPAPSYRLMMPLIMAVADQHNYGIVDLDHLYAKIVVSRAALQHPLYLQYFLLGMPGTCIATAYATPVHAGCVALEGRGILLCGDSGAGKSTLSYACARNGWTYVSDDACFLLNGGSQRIISGDCFKVRFRPEAVELFPEIRGLKTTPRAAGKPSIELRTDAMPQVMRSQTAHVDFVVFLNRRSGGPQQLVPYRKEVVRQFMRQVLIGSAITRAVQYAAIENLLTAEILELRYSDIHWAVDHLRMLVEKGG